MWSWDTQGSAKSATEAVKAIYASKGLGGFYSGFTGLIARDLPYRAMQVPLLSSQRACTEHDGY